MADSIELDLPGAERRNWLEWRRGGIGSSDAAAIAGVDPWQGPMGVWLDKTGRRRLEDEDREYQRWGKLLEPAIAAEFEERTGLFVRRTQAMVQHEERAWMRATVDGIVFDLPPGLHAPYDAALGILEIKTVAGFKSAAWGSEDEPLVPDHITVQVQHQLAVTDLAHAWIAVLFGGQRLALREVVRDEALIGSLIAMEEAFWQRVLDDVPPGGDGTEGSTSALLDAFGTGSRPEPVELPDEAENLIAARQAARAAVAYHAKLQEAAEQSLMAMLGHAEVGTRGGRPLVTWKPQTRKEHTVKGSTYRVLRIVGRADEEEG